MFEGSGVQVLEYESDELTVALAGAFYEPRMESRGAPAKHLKVTIGRYANQDFHGQRYLRYGKHWAPHLEGPGSKLVRYYTRAGLQLKARAYVLRAFRSFYTTLFSAKRNGSLAAMGKPAYVGQVVYNNYFWSSNNLLRWWTAVHSRMFTLKLCAASKKLRKKSGSLYKEELLCLPRYAHSNCALRDLHFHTEDFCYFNFRERLRATFGGLVFHHDDGVLRKRRGVIYARAINRWRSSHGDAAG